jgi:hypothetical protein
MHQCSRNRRHLQLLAQASAILGIALTTFSGAIAHAQGYGDAGDQREAHFRPGNIVVSRSVYDNNPANVTVGTVLPPNCASTQGGCAAATGAPKRRHLSLRLQQRPVRQLLRHHLAHHP